MIKSHIRTIGRKWIFLILCLGASALGRANINVSDTLTASKVFAEIPLEVLDMLRPSTRLDMLDYYTQADSILTVQDALGGVSRLEKVTPDYLKVMVTPVSTLEIKLLPVGGRQIVMTLYTVGSMESLPDGCVADTEVRFFDSQLNPLDSTKYLKVPTLKDFFNLKDTGISEADLKEKIPFTSIFYTTGSGDTPLEASFTSLSSLSREDFELLTPFLRPILSAPWKSKFQF